MDTASARVERRVRVLAVLAAAALLAGCASPATGDPEPDHETPAGPVSPDTYLCMGDRIPQSAIDDPLRIADLDEAGREAIAGATSDDGKLLELDDPESWVVASRSETTIVLIRAIDAKDTEDHAFNTHAEDDHETVKLSTELWPGWAVAAANSGCVLTVELDGLGVPYIWPDPDRPPTPESREIHLMVLDPLCGGDHEMPERIEVVQLDESDTEVGLLLGVEPLTGEAYDCEGFGPTPYALQLDAPLGDRAVVDLSRVERRELA